jgi:hypothetical protein
MLRQSGQKVGRRRLGARALQIGNPPFSPPQGALDDFGRSGRAWRETEADCTSLEAVITDLLQNQYSDPVRVIGFNTLEGWSRDVSDDIVRELRQRCADRGRDLPEGLRGFLHRHGGNQLPLPTPSSR